jgi:hypothetical protein
MRVAAATVLLLLLMACSKAGPTPPPGASVAADGLQSPAGEDVKIQEGASLSGLPPPPHSQADRSAASTTQPK